MPRNAGRPSMSLFVRNLAYDMSDDELRRVFLKYGHVRDVYVPKDYHTQEPRGFAYVQFEDIRDAEDAQYYVNGSRLRGRELEVQFAEGDRKTPGQMRGRPESPRRRSRSPRRRSRSPGKTEHSRLPRQRSPRRSRSPKRSGSRRDFQSRSRSLSQEVVDEYEEVDEVEESPRRRRRSTRE